MSFTVGIAGASGYAGGELLRLLAGHPDFEVRVVTANRSAGRPLAEVQPHVRTLPRLTVQETSSEAFSECDVVFFALPHGLSGALAAELSDTRLLVDCGADHRLERRDDWDRFYDGEFHDAWVYGVPELVAGAGKQRDLLADATRIAAPGCNASAVSLALAPGVKAGIIDATDIVAVLAVGPSGAGKSLHTHLLASEIMGSANPYAVGGVHRHIPEIQQSLRRAGAQEPSLSFTPVLVPMARGILATVTARVMPGVTEAHIRLAWEKAYADEPCVTLLPPGRFPRTSDVLGANVAVMGLALDEDAKRMVCVIAIDNLVKGTAGAAIQSANIALGLPETLGLPLNGVAP